MNMSTLQIVFTIPLIIRLEISNLVNNNMKPYTTNAYKNGPSSQMPGMQNEALCVHVP